MNDKIETTLTHDKEAMSPPVTPAQTRTDKLIDLLDDLVSLSEVLSEDEACGKIRNVHVHLACLDIESRVGLLRDLVRQMDIVKWQHGIVVTWHQEAPDTIAGDLHNLRRALTEAMTYLNEAERCCGKGRGDHKLFRAVAYTGAAALGAVNEAIIRIATFH